MERRSSRQRKRVNYHEFTGGCDSGDSEADDFAGCPPTKKAKTEKKSVRKYKQDQKQEIPQLPNNGQLQKQQTMDEPKGRLSREEKQFNRDLHQAVAASVHDMNQPGSDTSSPVDNRNNKEHDGDFCPSSEEDGSDLSSCVLTEEDDDSDFDASPHPKGAGKGKGAKVGQKKVTSEAEKRKTKAKEKKVVAKPTASKGRQKATISISPTTKPVGGGLEATRNSSLPGTQRTPGLGVRRMPKWTPPARVGGENANAVRVKSSPISSGGNPVIRVGLSRNVRVKSLHAKVNIRNT